MKINIDLTNFQKYLNRKYLDALYNKSRFLILCGGAGSGKSHFCAQKTISRILVGMTQGLKHNIWIFRKTRPSAKKSIFDLIKHYIYLWDLNNICTINKTELSFNFVNGASIHCAGLDDPEKIKSLAFITSAWLEEATEFTEDDFRQINLRLRGFFDGYKQIMLSFNPISKHNWVYKRFFKIKDERAYILKTTYKDNKFIDEEYKNELKKLIHEDKNYYNVYTLGLWGVLKGLIYTNWKIDDDIPKNYERISYGIDFGYNNPTALVKIIQKENECWIKELIYKKNLTNSDLISLCENIIIDDNVIYADSAEPDRIEEFRRAGFNIRAVMKSKNSVKTGIDYIKRKKINITSDSLNVIKEINNYRWKEVKDNANKNEEEQPVKFLDHAMDAMRYGFNNGHETKEFVFI